MRLSHTHQMFCSFFFTEFVCLGSTLLHFRLTYILCFLKLLRFCLRCLMSKLESSNFTKLSKTCRPSLKKGSCACVRTSAACCPVDSASPKTKSGRKSAISNFLSALERSISAGHRSSDVAHLFLSLTLRAVKTRCCMEVSWCQEEIFKML